MRTIRTTGILTITLLAPALAWAHPQHAGSGFFPGFTHPFLGLDHLLAMIMVGVWAAQIGGRAVWALPAAFVAAMAAGGMLGFAAVEVPVIEPLLAASVLVLGLLLTLNARVSVVYGASVAAVFALFHGAAHMAEAPAPVNLVAYGTGFVIATALLHVTGILAGLAASGRVVVLRLAAAPIALAGAWILVSRLH